jgi:BioD-like phosphotransacetylase family protein
MNKVPGIYVVSTSGFSGKTAFCLGLTMKFKSLGYRIGYFKPIGTELTRWGVKAADEDAVLMKEVLQLDFPIEVINPLSLRTYFLDEYMKVDRKRVLENILEAYRKASENRDIMIVEGAANASMGEFLGASAPALAKILAIPILLISKAESDSVVDDVLHEKIYVESLGAQFLGVVFTHIKVEVIKRVEGFIKPYLEKSGIRVLGLMPEEVTLTAPTAREICEELDGEILARKDELDKLVEDFYIGAMTPESALRYFRRSTNKAVILGGDRDDVAITALETSTSLLVLTGGIYPSAQVLNRAEATGTPVVLVPYDTFTTVRMLERVSGRIKPENKKKIEIAEKLVDKHVKWKDILDLTLKASTKG